MRLTVPGDKSLTQRALIFAALGTGRSRLRGLLYGGDAASTRGALAALGAPIPPIPADGGEITVDGLGLRGLRTPAGPLDLGNSGTGTRLLMGVLAGTGLEATLTGDESLRSRPMRRVTDPLARMGAGIRFHEREDRLPLTLTGRHPLDALEWVSPVASAQVKSALLLAGLTGAAPVSVTEPRLSRDHTERMLAEVGVAVVSGPAGEGWRVELRDPPSAIGALDFHVPGDVSSAAFLLALAALGGVRAGEVALDHVGLNPTRTAFLDVLRRMGCALSVEAATGGRVGGEPVGTVSAGPGSLRGTTVEGAEIPWLIDELPLVAVLGARAEGVTRIRGAEELRTKESDRIRAMVDNLRAVGVRAEEYEDGLEVEGTDAPLQGDVRTHGDHRIAMAFGVLGALAGNRIRIDDPGAADVSFPGFWTTLSELSGGAARGPAPVPARRPIVTLDGPAGSGKSSTARAVATALGYHHLDSGALYRALTFALLDAGVPDERWDALGEEDFRRLEVRVDPASEGFTVTVAGRPVDRELRTAEVTERVARLAGLPAARAALIELQRSVGARGGLVADGRDMGTIVFPDAEAKVFLVADLEERARRRLRENGVPDPDAAALREQMAQIDARDRQDSDRALAPLREPAGALRLDTTALSFPDQVQAVVDLVRRLTVP